MYCLYSPLLNVVASWQPPPPVTKNLILMSNNAQQGSQAAFFATLGLGLTKIGPDCGPNW